MPLGIAFRKPHTPQLFFKEFSETLSFSLLSEDAFTQYILQKFSRVLPSSSTSTYVSSGSCFVIFLLSLELTASVGLFIYLFENYEVVMFHLYLLIVDGPKHRSSYCTACMNYLAGKEKCTVVEQ